MDSLGSLGAEQTAAGGPEQWLSQNSQGGGTLSLRTWLWLEICLRLYRRRVASVHMAAMSSLRPRGRPKNLILVRPLGGMQATPTC